MQTVYKYICKDIHLSTQVFEQKETETQIAIDLYRVIKADGIRMQDHLVFAAFSTA